MWGKVSKLELNTLIMICKEMSLRHPSANLGWRPVIAGMTVQYTWWDVNCLGSTTVNSSSVWPWTCLTPLCPAAEQDTAAGSICSEITKERVLSSPSTHLLPQWCLLQLTCMFVQLLLQNPMGSCWSHVNEPHRNNSAWTPGWFNSSYSSHTPSF